MCREKDVVQGVKIEELFDSDEERRRVGELGRCKGKEIEDIPLCAKCVEEIGPQRVHDEHLIHMALDQVDSFDAGLSRRRWEARQEGQSEPIRRTPSPIYVSSQDPLGEPAFKRSPTKPIPKWMQYLPSYRQKDRDFPERPTSVVDNYLSNRDASLLSSDTEEQDLSPPPPVPPHTIPIRFNPPTYTPKHVSIQRSRRSTLTAEEPVQRPSSKKPGICRFTPVKHVRFDTNPRGPLAPVTSSNDRGKSPSGSPDFLERYSVSSPCGVRSSTLYIRSRTDQADGRYTRALSPFLRCGDAHPLSLEESLESGNRSVQANSQNRSSSSVKHDHVAPEAASAAPRPEIGQCGPQGYGDGSHPNHLKYTTSSSSSLHIGADGTGENSRRGRQSTFQDQLKVAFGFS